MAWNAQRSLRPTSHATYHLKCQAPFPNPVATTAAKLTTTTRLCEAHAAEAVTQENADRKADPIRKLYSTVRWKHIRKTVLFENPICMNCDSWASEECDHHVPAHQWIAQHNGDMNSFYDTTNLSALCKKCHSTKTAKEVGWSGSSLMSRTTLEEIREFRRRFDWRQTLLGKQRREDRLRIPGVHRSV